MACRLQLLLIITFSLFLAGNQTVNGGNEAGITAYDTHIDQYKQ